MKVLQLNTVYARGSTGNIAKNIHDLCQSRHIECITGCRCVEKGQETLEDVVAISSKWDSRIHGWVSRFTMFKGVGSYFKTKKFLKKMAQYAPDVIHMHNLHGSYVNLPLLFRFIKKYDIPVVWTLHDCWPFTAICPYYIMAQCNKWKTGCHHCPQRKQYSCAPIDFSKSVWSVKKKWFGGLSNVTLVTPSNWLADETRESFLKDYPVMTINNGIDLQIFSPTESTVLDTYHVENKKILLGVAFGWEKKKGIDVFISLANRLSDEYQIVLVGTDETVDAMLPSNIISIHRTHNQAELARLYSQADVFVNPTREDNFPTVNLEALACGTPVITFKTGGSPECIDSSCGVVVEAEDIDHMEQEIIRICTQHPYDKDACRKRAESFDKTQRFEEYIALYEQVVKKHNGANDVL